MLNNVGTKWGFKLLKCRIMFSLFCLIFFVFGFGTGEVGAGYTQGEQQQQQQEEKEKKSRLLCHLLPPILLTTTYT